MNASPPVPSQAVSVMPPASPRPWLGFVVDFIIAMAILFGVVMAGVVGWGVVQGIRVGAQNPGAAANPDALARSIGEPGVALMMGISSLGMLLAGVLTYYWRRRATSAERQQSRAAAAQVRTWVEAIGLGVALFVAGTALMWMLERAGHAPNPSNMKMLEALLAYSPALLLLVGVVIAPLSEELLFRRVLFGRLWAAGKPAAGMLASSVLFAFAHELPGTTASPWAMTLILLLFYAAMGACLAWIYRRTGTLWAPIATHATNNLLGCGMMLAGYAG